MNQLITFRSLALIGILANMEAGAQTLREATMLTENEQFARAGSMFRTLLTTDASNGETWFQFGENYYQWDRMDSAAYCYQRGTEVNPRHPLCHVGVGKILWAKRDTAQARTHFKEAVRSAMDKANKFPKGLQARTYRELAEAYMQGTLKDLAQANGTLDKSLDLDPNDPESYILKGDILFEMNPIDASASLVNYKRAGELAPMSSRPLTKRALIYHRGANYEAAIAEYTKAIEKDPSYAPAYTGRAESYFMLRNYDLATADYDQYLALNKGDRDAMVRYAQFLFLVKKYPESLAMIRDLEGQGVQNNVLTRIKGYGLVEMGDTANALPTMEAYLQAQPKDKVLVSDLQYYGRAYALLGQDSLAGEQLMAAAAMPKADPDLYAEAATYFQRARMYLRAMEAYQLKVASTKVAVNDWYYLGSLANRVKEFKVADTAWATYVEKQPNVHQGYMGRARANVGLDPEKKTWQARPFYEDALRRMKPEDIAKSRADYEEACFYLGFLHFYSSKDLPAAKCWFEKVKALNAATPNSKVANDMLLSKELKDVPVGTCDL